MDLIKLKKRYDEIEKTLKSSDLPPTDLEVLKNGRQTIFAIMGMCYRIANSDMTEKDISLSPKSLGTIPFVYGPLLSNYHKDDVYEKFERIIRDIIDILSEVYQQAYDNNTTTSVTNFMKTDLKYYTEIVPKVIKQFRYNVGDDLKKNIDILKR